MPLTENRRQQLDGIVQKMITNRESDSDIQLVVNDFKHKYAGEGATQAATIAPESRSVAERVGGFFGLENLARGAAQAVYGQTPEFRGVERSISRAHESRNKLFQMAERAKQAGDTRRYQQLLRVAQSQQIPDLETDVFGERGLATPRQVAGSAVQTAATMAGLGQAPAASFAGRVGQSVGFGATLGAGRSLEQEGGVRDILSAAAVGGVAGAAVPAAIEGITGVGKKVLTGTAENIYKRLIKTPVEQIRVGKEQLAPGLLKRGVKGNYQQMFDQVAEASDKARRAADDIITTNADKPVDVSDVYSTLKDLAKSKSRTPGSSAKAAQTVLTDFKSVSQGKKQIPLKVAQELKKALQGEVNYYKRNPTGLTEAQKVAAYKLRLAIEKTVPDIIPQNKEMDFAIRAAERLQQTAALSPNKLRILMETILGGYGVLNDPRILGIVALERLVTSPQVASRAAVTANQLGQRSLPPQVASLLQRLGVAGTVGQAPSVVPPARGI